MTTASASSRGPVLRSASRKCQAPVVSSPEAVTRRTMNPRWLRWTATDAAAETAASSEEAMPWPRWETTRLSRKTVARDCQGCSSRRTISSPIRAEERQCTRRRSSPWRYSRTVTSSADPVANARGRLSPEPVQPPPSGIVGSGTVRGVTVEGHGGAERPAELDQAERVADPHRHRADLELARGCPIAPGRSCAAASRGRCPRARTAAGCRARRAPGPRAAGRRSGSGPRW